MATFRQILEDMGGGTGAGAPGGTTTANVAVFANKVGISWPPKDKKKEKSKDINQGPMVKRTWLSTIS